MRLRSTIPCLIVLAVAIAMIPTVSAASYTLSINPSTTVSLGTPMTFILSLSGGFKNTAYTILFAVVKPNGNGVPQFQVSCKPTIWELAVFRQPTRIRVGQLAAERSQQTSVVCIASSQIRHLRRGQSTQ